MNRAERRRMMKKNPHYRKMVKRTVKKAVQDLEESFKKKWRENDENGIEKENRNESE